MMKHIAAIAALVVVAAFAIAARPIGPKKPGKLRNDAARVVHESGVAIGKKLVAPRARAAKVDVPVPFLHKPVRLTVSGRMRKKAS